MNPTKNILLTAALAGLVAGATVNAQADHHEGDKAAHADGKHTCKGENGCHDKAAKAGHDKPAAKAAPAKKAAKGAAAEAHGQAAPAEHK